MSKYSEEFLKEYEDVFSDSEIQARRSASGNVNTSDNYDRSGYYSGRNRNTVYSRNVHSGNTRPMYVQRKRKRRVPRKVRRALILTVAVLIVLALLTGVIAIAKSVSGIGDVTELKAAEVAAHQIVLNWEEVRHAEGYRVMMSKGGSGDYTEYQTISDPDTLSVTVTDLEQAEPYDFSVTALRGKTESKKPARLENICTLPDAPEITNIYSAKKGSLHLDWSMNDKANGYIVEYKKDGGEYTDSQKVTVTDPEECRTDITELEVGAVYCARVSAYISRDGQLSSAPSAEQSVQIAAQDVQVMPKAPVRQVDGTIDPSKPMIALTFDDGPLDGGSGERILDVLEQYNAKATFFMVGCNVTDHESNLKRKVQLKMELGNHTWNHAHYGDEVTPEDIRMASNEIYNISGQYPTCFRSPGGMTTDTILNECSSEGMAAYYWSIDTEDWKTLNADSIYHNVMDYVQDGDIILMHEIYDATADAVERMVPELIEQGYQLVTCHDLITLKTGSEPVPGTQYYSAYSE